MNYEIVELQLTGEACTFYSLLEEGQTETLFEKFQLENLSQYKIEIKEITTRLKAMANSVGALRNFFKENEGQFGDKVCALFDQPEHRLRLYCYRDSEALVILGGGGPKYPGIKAYQEEKKLNEEANKMKELSKDLRDKFYSKDIRRSMDKKKLIGILKIQN